MEAKMNAEYIGFQEGFEDIPGLHLFNIVAPGDPMDGTTVEEKTLDKLGIENPIRDYPIPMFFYGP